MVVDVIEKIIIAICRVIVTVMFIVSFKITLTMLWKMRGFVFIAELLPKVVQLNTIAGRFVENVSGDAREVFAVFLQPLQELLHLHLRPTLIETAFGAALEQFQDGDVNFALRLHKHSQSGLNRVKTHGDS